MNFSSSGEAIFSICKSGEFSTDTGAAFTDELKRCRLATPPSDGFAFRSSVSGRLMPDEDVDDDDDDAAAAAVAVANDGAIAPAGIVASTASPTAAAAADVTVEEVLLSGSKVAASSADGLLAMVSRMVALLLLLVLTVDKHLLVARLMCVKGWVYCFDSGGGSRTKM